MMRVEEVIVMKPKDANNERSEINQGYRTKIKKMGWQICMVSNNAVENPDARKALLRRNKD